MARKLISGVSLSALVFVASVVAISTQAAATPAAVAQQTMARQLVGLQQLRDIVDGQSDRYAGLSTDGAGRVTIHLLNSRSATAAADTAKLQQTATSAGIKVSVDYQKHSLRELNQVNVSIPVEGPFAATDSGLTRWGINPDTNSVEVGVAEVTPELLAKAREAYGDKVTVTRRSRSIDLVGRRTDTPPYYGGDMLDVGAPVGRCSSGFTLTNASGVRYAITAGHCAPVGRRVETNNASYFGTVQFQRLGGGNLDNALIGGARYSGRIWVGGPATTTSLPVRSAQNSCTNCLVSFDGSFTGESLMKVVRGPYCETMAGGDYSCGLWEAVHQGSYIGCQGGDSGGPVFARDGRGGVIAVGIIKAGYSFTDCIYTSIPDILRYWQATITTG
ncbi:hypothetical protein O7635_30645 [Asanoa sp. WMMD1127]|uniref:hypothetical protein n=1 Tax=Asanoa sp. WMMD1127 TaxID=3016107 RepID=UPI002417599E|nr:hypothetical protein [Asanoa sp. WMMD1127]MDG4826231.1 hypothetical protein [Asanoa sp. WMMD1127]